jgi:hypothetical protein
MLMMVTMKVMRFLDVLNNGIMPCINVRMLERDGKKGNILRNLSVISQKGFAKMERE